MTATLTAPQDVQKPPAPTYRRIDFPAPVVRRVPGLRRLLGGLPLGVAPIGFLVSFVTLSTYVPGCVGDDVTSTTTVSGRDVLAGHAHGVIAPTPVQHSLHAAAPWSHAVLIACVLFALLILIVPRYPAAAAAAGGGVVLVLLGGLESALGSGYRVHTDAELGEVVIVTAALLSLVAGLAMHRWRPRPITAWARCAGFLRRLLAFFIDVLILLLVTLVVSVVSQPLAGWLFIPMILAYWPAWEMSRFRATPGKQALGLVVAMDDGSAVSGRRCAVRHALRFVSILTLIGAAMAGGDERGRALHDFACHTVVVRGVEPLA
jgi:uncharacterized RDD family membrane protein YckC